MAIECSIDTIRKVWVNEHYVLVRPWPENEACVEFCTEPGPDSAGFFGKVSIAFGTPEGLKTLAKALILAADEMEQRG